MIAAGAPKQWTVPDWPAAALPIVAWPVPAPATPARGGHHDWGAVMAAVAAGAAGAALVALLGTGTSAAGLDDRSTAERLVHLR